MKTVLLFLCFVVPSIATAKTRYVAKYQNYIHIANNGDTIYRTGFLPTEEIKDPNGVYIINIKHEIIDEDKSKKIKRAKRAASWSVVAAVSSGISVAYSRNILDYYIKSSYSKVLNELSAIYATEAQQEQHLMMEVWVDNISEREIMICDMQRGLVWYVRPRQTLEISVNNPDLCQLRISDIHNDNVSYATIAAGSMAEKKTVLAEYGDTLIVEELKQLPDGTPVHERLKINTKTFERQQLTYQEYKALRGRKE